jgi:hypothetical protein
MLMQSPFFAAMFVYLEPVMLDVAHELVTLGIEKNIPYGQCLGHERIYLSSVKSPILLLMSTFNAVFISKGNLPISIIRHISDSER